MLTFVLTNLRFCQRFRAQKPRRKEACGRAIGTKSRVLLQAICFLHCCPPPGPELSFPFWGRGKLWFGRGALCNAGEPEIRTHGSSVRFFSPWLLRVWLGTERDDADVGLQEVLAVGGSFVAFCMLLFDVARGSSTSSLRDGFYIVLL